MEEDYCHKDKMMILLKPFSIPSQLGTRGLLSLANHEVQDSEDDHNNSMCSDPSVIVMTFGNVFGTDLHFFELF